MQNPVKERIVKLREEIAQISEANRLYLHGGKMKPHGAGGITHVGFSGYQEILDEFDAEMADLAGTFWSCYRLRIVGANQPLRSLTWTRTCQNPQLVK
jgi:hypothetical protein